MTIGSIRDRYDYLKKTYNLPDFEKLDLEFELNTIDRDDFLLSDIRKKMMEKIEFFCDIIESSLQPDTSSLASMHECKFLEDEEKEKLYKLYKRLMFLNKSAILLGINSTDKDELVFINIILKEMPEVKRKILSFVNKVKENWRNGSDIKEEIGYLG
tara:strand:- start:245 stop:715 length:471 start_codon:yes stop_codon:yes gene_type:complete